MSQCTRKPKIYICENKGTDQLCCNCTADDDCGYRSENMWVQIREHVGKDQRTCGYRSENMWVQIREHVGTDQRTRGYRSEKMSVNRSVHMGYRSENTWVTNQRTFGYRSENMWVLLRDYVEIKALYINM